MTTGDLFDSPHRHFQAIGDARAHARRTDPETSKQAAADVAPHAENDRMLALCTLARHGGGLTDFELGDLTGKAQTSIGCRRAKLRDDGFVQAARDSLGRIRKRPAPSGSDATVWQLTSKGIALFAEMHGSEA